MRVCPKIKLKTQNISKSFQNTKLVPKAKHKTQFRIPKHKMFFQNTKHNFKTQNKKLTTQYTKYNTQNTN